MTLVKTLIAVGALALAGTSTANAQGDATSLGLTGGAATAATIATVVVVVGVIAAVASDDDSAATTTTN